MENHWKIIGRSLEDHWKIIGISLEYHWNIIGISLEYHGAAMFPCVYCGIIMGKSLEFHEKAWEQSNQLYGI